MQTVMLAGYWQHAEASQIARGAVKQTVRIQV